MDDIKPICAECNVSHAEEDCPLVRRPTQPLRIRPRREEVCWEELPEFGGEAGVA